MRSCGAGTSPDAHQPPRRGLVQRVHHQRGFAAARHAGDAGEGAERESGGDRLQVVAARIDHAHDAVLLHRAAHHRHVDPPPPGEIIASQRLRICRHLRPASPPPPRGRHRCRRPDPYRSGGPPRGSPPRHAPPPERCCRGRAAAAACRAGVRCRAGAGRSTVRRARTARRSGRSRSGWPAGCAGSRRPTAWRNRATRSGSRARHRPGTAAARRSRAGCGGRSPGAAASACR